MLAKLKLKRTECTVYCVMLAPLKNILNIENVGYRLQTDQQIDNLAYMDFEIEQFKICVKKETVAGSPWVYN